LSRRQKAAVIVRFLLNEGAEVTLRDLPDQMQADLTQVMAQMRYVDRTTLAAVVQEFAQELEEIGLSFPGGIAGALNALDGRINPLTAARLRKEAGVRQAGDPWDQIRQQEPGVLTPLIEQESTEVAAVILSKLDVSCAAEILNSLPGALARRITYAISLTGAVTPEAVDRIGLSLAAQINDRPERAFAAEPVERIGAILNRSATITRDDVLEGLEETDSQFARQVRDAIFTFANIATRIDPKDVPAITREVDQAQLVTALAAATGEAVVPSRDFILNNMSKRMADQLRDDISDLGKVRDKDGEVAMGAVVEAIRDMEAAGTLEMILPDEEG
jgi:flagellar motor switch protein FliG